MTRNTFEPDEPEDEDLSSQCEDEEDTPLPELAHIEWPSKSEPEVSRPGKEEFLEQLELRQISMGYSVTRQHTIDRIKRELGFNYPK